MRKKLLALICILAVILLVAGCGNEQEGNDSLWGKGYYVDITRPYTYACFFGTQSESPDYCMTEDHWLVFAGSRPILAAQLEAIPFDKAEFSARFTGESYWNSHYDLDYVTGHTEKAWRGQVEDSEAYVYLLQLDTQELMLARTNKNGVMTEVLILKPSATQKEYFALWDEDWQKHKDGWPDVYPTWEALNKKYG